MLNVMNKPICTLLIIMLCATALLAAAQETTAPELSPEDQQALAAYQAEQQKSFQQAFDRGLMAVQLQEWGLAIRYFSDAQEIASHFSDAQKAAPHASTVLFNLGLAHARAGHELPAIAWLHAYLDAAPQAPNAEAIRAEIERLKTVLWGKMNTIFQTAIDAVQQLDPPGDRWVVIDTIALYQAYTGDVEGAIATRKLADVQLEEPSKLSSKYWSVFARQRIGYGDLERAQEALKNVTELEDQMAVAREKEKYANSGEMSVQDWNTLADMFSGGGTATSDLEKALEDAAESKGQFASHGKTAKDRIQNLLNVADWLGINLNKIIFLERKSGQERGGK